MADPRGIVLSPAELRFQSTALSDVANGIDAEGHRANGSMERAAPGWGGASLQALRDFIDRCDSFDRAASNKVMHISTAVWNHAGAMDSRDTSSAERIASVDETAT